MHRHQIRRPVRLPLVGFLIVSTLLAMAGRAYAQADLLLYVPNSFGNSVSVLRTNADGSLTPVTTLVGMGTTPRVAAVRGDQAFAYVTSDGSHEVRVIDTSTNTVVQTETTGLNFPIGVAVSPDGTRVYVANNGGNVNTVSVFSADATTGQLTPLTTIAVGPDPRAVKVSRDGTRAYVANQGPPASGSVSVIDTASNTVITTVATGGQLSDVAVNPAGTRVYVVDINNRVFVIDTASDTVVATVTTDLSGPRGVVVSADGTRFYVTNTNGHSITQFDAATNASLGTLGAGLNPSLQALSPTGEVVYVAGLGSNTVQIFTVSSTTGLLTDNGNAATENSPFSVGLCGNGNALLALGSTFRANTAGAVNCAGSTVAFTGGTLKINGASLSIVNAMTLGADGGTIDTNSNSATLSGSIASTGALTKTGAGTLTLAGSNTYSGATTIAAGTLQAGAANTFSSASAISIAAGAALDLNGFSQAVPSLEGTGMVTLGSATLTTGSANTSTTYAGAIGGTGGLTKVGTGTFTLSSNSGYSGATTIDAGILRVDGTQASSAVTVNNGATLQGSGTVAAIVVNAGGTVAPGASPGTLTAGAVTFAAGSTYAVELNGTTAGTEYDQLVATGAVALNGTTLSVTRGFTPAVGTAFTILTVGAGTPGLFNGLAEGSTFALGQVAFRISYVGGDGNDVVLTVVNDLPTISDVGDQAIDEDDATSALAFTVSDLESTSASLTMSGSSSDTTLVPSANIVFGGSDSNRTVTVTPAANQHGSVMITITVTDGGGATRSDTFTLTVNAVNDAPTISDVTNQTIDEDGSTGPLAFTITDVDTAAGSLTLAGSSSNTTVVPNTNIVFGGSGANRTVTITPAADQHGSATIRVTVSDGALTAFDEFTLTVNPVNDAPVLAGLSNQTITVGSSTGPLPFTVSDVETAAASLTVSASSSNTPLVPNVNIVFGGAGTDRTVTITPAAGESGSATIAVTVSDGELTSTAAIVLTVTPNQPPTISGPSNVSLEENTSATVALTVGDDLTALNALTVTATAANTTLFPPGSLALSGTGANRTLTVTPAPDREGTSALTVTVSDGELTSSMTVGSAVHRAGIPEAPTDLTAQAMDTEVVLNWRGPASGATPTYYVIEVGAVAGASTLPVINTRARVTTHTLTLPPGAYFVRVRSGNSSGVGSISNEIAVSVSSSRNVPGTPLALTADIRGTHVTLAWQRPVAGGPVDAWRLEIMSPLGPHTLDFAREVQIVNADVPIGNYLVRVHGLNAAGQGPSSNEVAFVVAPDSSCIGGRPEPPALLPASVTGELATVSWLAPQNAPVTGYRVIGGLTPGGSDLVVDLAAVQSISGRLPPGRYYVAIVALNGCGASEPSNTIEVRVGTETEAPPAPPVVRAQIDGRRVTLQWDAVAGASSYLIEAGTASGRSDIIVYPYSGTQISVVNVPTGTYYVRVRSVGAAGTSAPSHEFVLVVP